ncbi:MAG TPA: hypothetical protein DIC42_04395 [Holosporales bacterium]|nr:hypothetical protein [Holosporales bacterium]
MKTINIVPYSVLWPKNFSDEAHKIKDCLGDNCIIVHHIGSTAVPGLLSKNTIDILCIVKNLQDIKNLESQGYIGKGELNIPLRYYYSNNTIEPRINLHICEQDHGFVALNLSFRDYLRHNTTARDAYAALKTDILKSDTANNKPQGCFSNYNLQKDVFIRSILKKCNFAQYAITFCMHYAEQEACKRLLAIDDTELNAHLQDSNTYLFCLYHGEKIIGICLLLLKDGSLNTIRFSYDHHENSPQDQLYFKSFVCKWLHTKNIAFNDF